MATKQELIDLLVKEYNGDEKELKKLTNKQLQDLITEKQEDSKAVEVVEIEEDTEELVEEDKKLINEVKSEVESLPEVSVEEIQISSNKQAMERVKFIKDLPNQFIVDRYYCEKKGAVKTLSTTVASILKRDGIVI